MDPSTAERDTFTNPVLAGFHPDPSICRARGRFYLVTSSFEYFPGIPLFVSDDLVTWEPIGHVLDRRSQLELRDASPSGGLFAPTIRHHDGTFYVTCTNVSGGGHFVVSSDDPAAGWSDPVWIAQDGIDPSLYFEGDDVYFTSNVQPDPGGPHEQVPSFRRGIQQSRIDLRSGAVLEGPRFVWAGTGARYPEAPHLYRRHDWYYLLIAEGGTEYGHIASVGRSRSPWGPFEPSPHGPVIDHRSAPSAFQAMGHADLVELDDDEWWAVCLGIRPVGGWPHHLLGRETFLAPVTWTADGWPVVGDGGQVDAVLRRPGLPITSGDRPEGPGDFDAPTLAPEWSSVRVPFEDAGVHLQERSLVLRPAGRALDGRTPCFVGRRQQHHRCTVAASLTLESPHTGDEVGVMVRMNDTHYYALGVRFTGRELEVRLRQRFAHIDLDAVIGSLPSGQPITVELDADDLTYAFAVTDGTTRVSAPALDSVLISTEVAGGFTGAFVGPYATSEAPISGSARVDRFDYRQATG